MNDKRILELSDDALEGVAGGITAETINIGSGQSAALTLDPSARRSAVDVPPEVLDAFKAARTSGGGDIASLVSRAKEASVMTGLPDVVISAPSFEQMYQDIQERTEKQMSINKVQIKR